MHECYSINLIDNTLEYEYVLDDYHRRSIMYTYYYIFLVAYSFFVWKLCYLLILTKWVNIFHNMEERHSCLAADYVNENITILANLQIFERESGYRVLINGLRWADGPGMVFKYSKDGDNRSSGPSCHISKSVHNNQCTSLSELKLAHKTDMFCTNSNSRT